MARTFRLLPSHVAKRLIVGILGWSSLMLMTGCTIQPDRQVELGKLHQGVVAVREQTAIALHDVNRVTLENAIARVVQAEPLVLKEGDFAVVLPPDDIRQWDQAFAVLESYVAALQQLASAGRDERFETSALQLASKLQQSSWVENELPGFLTPAATQFGEGLIEARTRAEVAEIMVGIDPSISKMLRDMATAIYDPSTNSGIRSTVLTNWRTKLTASGEGTPQGRWEAATEGGSTDDAKRQVIQAYIAMLDARDKQIAALDQLRASLMALAELHHAVAEADPLDTAGSLAYVIENVRDARELSRSLATVAEEN